ncbi:MAG: hypothetical protein CBC83_02030, partial [Flavobacteriales bacterium TMED123]
MGVMSEPLEKASAHELAINWLKAFENALVANDMVAVDELFVEDSYWRDLVAFTWRLSTFSGLGNINAAMREFVLPARPKNIQLAVDRTPPRWVNRVGVDTIEAIFCFETNSGK